MAIRRYLGIESVNHKGEPIKLGHWCASEDVEKLEATLVQKDAEIERLKKELLEWQEEFARENAYGHTHPTTAQYEGKIARRLQAENEALKAEIERLKA